MRHALELTKLTYKIMQFQDDVEQNLLKYVQKQNVEEVKKLLKRDRNLSKVTYHIYDENRNIVSDGSILYYAAKTGNKELCQLLLDHGSRIDVGRYNPVIFGAVESGNKEIVELFLDQGASPEKSCIVPSQGDNSQRSMLKIVDFAKQLGFVEIEELLRERIREKKQDKVDLNEINFTKNYTEESPLLPSSSPKTTDSSSFFQTIKTFFK